MQFDEATSRRIEATYTTPDMSGQRQVIRAALGLRPGEDVLDIGSGPGFPASEMSAEVGPGGIRHRRRPEPEHARHRPRAAAGG
jgi:arsenite methyltransferase